MRHHRRWCVVLDLLFTAFLRPEYGDNDPIAFFVDALQALAFLGCPMTFLCWRQSREEGSAAAARGWVYIRVEKCCTFVLCVCRRSVDLRFT
jgi:hypothetical protein